MPLLEVHLFEDSGCLRQHVIFFHNEDLIRRGDELDVPIRSGDKLTILNSVAGGQWDRTRRYERVC
jgi:molybdopterin synthase sulfur carrier subunit